MPEISAQWLLFNRGEMLLNTGNYTEELRRVQSEKDMLWERYDKAIETIGALRKEIDDLRGDVERKKHA
jgi:predicted nuclease with TOPRIM domain